MYAEVRDGFTDQLRGYKFFCHCCGASKTMRRRRRPNGWVIRREAAHSPTGRRFDYTVTNHYCPSCSAAGANSAVVARILKAVGPIRPIM